ncbi:MAG TPA: Mov34/MPN/PAD-1 family protein [Candidatus Baltobacteraceae bacterium]|nr:Mov34/MPN/PAD-1 family protein [Candidatus Baltobacteraceae bacterium]
MIGYIRRAISAIIAPRARLRLNSHFFADVIAEIHRRGDEKRESGAFLLGSTAEDGARVADDVIYYEDLDPRCTRYGAIALESIAFAKAWSIASERGKQIVADLHSHPGCAEQSAIDKANPAVALPGHIALIVPDFGRRRGSRSGLGVFEYLGGHKWRAIDAARQRKYLDIGWWV